MESIDRFSAEDYQEDLIIRQRSLVRARTRGRQYFAPEFLALWQFIHRKYLLNFKPEARDIPPQSREKPDEGGNKQPLLIVHEAGQTHELDGAPITLSPDSTIGRVFHRLAENELLGVRMDRSGIEALRSEGQVTSGYGLIGNLKVALLTQGINSDLIGTETMRGRPLKNDTMTRYFLNAKAIIVPKQVLEEYDNLPEDIIKIDEAAEISRRARPFARISGNTDLLAAVQLRPENYHIKTLPQSQRLSRQAFEKLTSLMMSPDDSRARILAAYYFLPDIQTMLNSLANHFEFTTDLIGEFNGIRPN